MQTTLNEPDLVDTRQPFFSKIVHRHCWS